MNHPINTNVIIGSRIALAMATGSPVRSQFSSPAEKQRILAAKRSKRRESIKKRSRQLLEELKAHDAELAADSHRLKTAPSKEKPELVALVVDKLVEQRVTFHSRVESMLEEMMKLIPSTCGKRMTG